MAMHTPEIMLKDLNSALRRLRGACASINNEEINEKLLEVMRKLLLAEVLGNTWILAVGGSQGAGKTTLMASLYDLDSNETNNWLKGNEGRGEQLPVLIQEIEGLQEPKGYVRRLEKIANNYELTDIPVDIQKFQEAICNPKSEDLLPVLKVPVRFFTRPNQAWLLLPGYEKQDRSNRSWQELMRQAMIGAGGCIVVTDETRMANQQQLEIAKDILENELSGLKPYIVVTKTEAHRSNTKRIDELRTSAQATFAVPAENVICSGVDDPEYKEKEWLPLLTNAIKDLNHTGAANRPAQLKQLTEIIGKDLAQVLTTIRSKAKIYYNSDKGANADGTEVLETVMEYFDEAAEELREKHQTQVVEKLVNSVFSEAQKNVDKRLIAEREGIKNTISNVLESTTETKGKMQQLVHDSWDSAVSAAASDGTRTSFQKRYVELLGELTLGELGRPNSAANVPESENASEHEKARTELGYQDASGLVKFEKLNANKVQDIQIFLGDETTQRSGDVSKESCRSTQLIPALSMEYVRLCYYKIYKDSENPAHHTEIWGATASDDTKLNIVEASVSNFKAGVELGRTALVSFASLLAVDVTTDGDSDILGALFGNKSPGQDGPQLATDTSAIPAVPTLHPIAVGAMAAVAAGFIAVRAMKSLRAAEKDASSQAHNMLWEIRDQHVNHLRKQFDDTIATARARIKERLRDRYKMDENLMHKDRLARAIAEVMSITKDFSFELSSSPVGLQSLGTSRA
jgi:hypothetical protein